MADFINLEDGFSVAPQISAEDFNRAAQLGITTVINNRPDGESPDQIPTLEAEQLAQGAGLAYHHIPIISGQVTKEAVEEYAHAMKMAAGPILAYCRTGTRSCMLWGLASALEGNLTTDQIISRGSSAGYDLMPLMEALESVRQD